MKNLTLFSLLALATGIVMMVSCKKGDAGPVGPAGPAGPDSISYSNWITLQMSPSDGGDSIYLQSITAPAITSDIMNKGTVIGYLLEPDPLTGDSSVIDASSDFDLTQNFGVGKISLVDYYENIQQYGTSYRYVVIPGTVAVTDASGTVQHYTADQLKKMSYKQVTQILNIPAKGSSLKLSSPN